MSLETCLSRRSRRRKEGTFGGGVGLGGSGREGFLGGRILVWVGSPSFERVAIGR